MDEEFSQLNTLKSLSASNFAALALLGFSGAFAIYLVHEVFQHHQDVLRVALNLAAALLLLGVRFVYWPISKNPRLARLGWRPFALAGAAVALAVLARAPQLHV